MDETLTISNAPHVAMNSVPTNTRGSLAASIGLVGNSAPMRELFAVLPKLAKTRAPVLITGESGTGKELIARAIHLESSRAQAPFIAVNCAALPDTLIQSELFGHEKGAFTGAHRRRIGKFEAAHGGTILLDEIGDLPIQMQVNLLRCLETQTIDRVGGGDSISVDVRIITATHVDLEAAVKAGVFREDLYYRLNVLGIVAPPLRYRGNDIELIAEYFFERFTDEMSRQRLGGFSDDARLALRQWHWPGNVRELRNRVQKATAMCDEGPVSREDLGLERRAFPRENMTLDEARTAAEMRAILTALDRTSGNITVAADQLGVCRMTLYRLMKKH
jgi:DNA-binding NtrC family response regulator